MDKEVQKWLQESSDKIKIVCDNLSNDVINHEHRIKELETSQIKMGEKILEDIKKIVLEKLDELKINIPELPKTSTSGDRSIQDLFS